MKSLISAVVMSWLAPPPTQAQDLALVNKPTKQASIAHYTPVVSPAHSNPDLSSQAAGYTPWLRDFSEHMAKYMVYPSRGRAYDISGKMYVKIGITPQGGVKVVGFLDSLGGDFEEAIREAIAHIPQDIIKPLGFNMATSLRVVVPVSFKSSPFKE